jgi:hypothetical protein
MPGLIGNPAAWQTVGQNPDFFFWTLEKLFPIAV